MGYVSSEEGYNGKDRSLGHYSKLKCQPESKMLG